MSGRTPTFPSYQPRSRRNSELSKKSQKFISLYLFHFEELAKTLNTPSRYRVVLHKSGTIFDTSRPWVEITYYRKFEISRQFYSEIFSFWILDSKVSETISVVQTRVGDHCLPVSECGSNLIAPNSDSPFFDISWFPN